MVPGESKNGRKMIYLELLGVMAAVLAGGVMLYGLMSHFSNHES